jgi:alkanesulfonate monooxygenase SsuD/methylene tetrahydromethanopterin reductase-like flavin-dependent oxidoreductase (luciferase family)
VILGGAGRRRTPRLAARYADEFNMPFHSVADSAASFGRVRDACTTAGRDLSTMTFSAAQTVCCGKDDAEVARRAEAIGMRPEDLRANGIAGTPAEVVDRIGAWADAGAERLYLQFLDLSDLGHLELLASEVLPQV